MKLIVLGGGAVQIKNIKITKGITSEDFVNTVTNGAAILEKLKERSSKISWANELGKIDWTDRRGNLILWFLTNDTSGA